MKRFLLATTLALAATALHADCIATCWSEYAADSAGCVTLEEDLVAICWDNHTIAVWQCEANRLECVLKCLENADDACGCTSGQQDAIFADCVAEADQTRAACQNSAHASRVQCEANAALAHEQCVEGCEIFLDGFESGGLVAWQVVNG